MEGTNHIVVMVINTPTVTYNTQITVACTLCLIRHALACAPCLLKLFLCRCLYVCLLCVRAPDAIIK